jgi:hypothetical protein
VPLLSLFLGFIFLWEHSKRPLTLNAISKLMLMCGYGANDIGAMKEAPLELALLVSQRSKSSIRFKAQFYRAVREDPL